MRWVLVLVAVGGCGSPRTVEPLPAALCDRRYDDPITVALCKAPPIADLRTLVAAVGLDPDLEGPTTVALSSNSTSLAARLVSPINPRVVLLKRDGAAELGRRRDPGFVVLAFTRGERFVELVSRDRQTKALRFVLVSFERDCGPGCAFTEAIESGWTNVTVRTDDDLKNTPLDCRRCHQPEGPSMPPLLRMQELRFPWTHWLARPPASATGAELLADFTAVHPPGEKYAGVPVARLASDVAPQALEALIEDEGFALQPNEFDARAIAAETADGGESATWNGLYARTLQGEAMPVPFPGLRATDPARQAAAAQAYATGGDLSGFAQLLTPDAERAMGLRPKAGATGRGILVQMCQGCHDGRLDPTISRARFDVRRLEAMPRGEKQLAISRMTLPAGNPGLMPPPRSGALSEEERAAAIAELER